MKIVKKNSIDFSKYTDNQLESSLINIDREKFPQNYEACLAEIDKRKVAGHFIAKEDKLSSSRAGAYLIQIYIFCFIGLFLAICTIFLLINQHSISTIAGFY